MSAMMRFPLSPVHFIERAESLFGRRSVVTASPAGTEALPWSRIASRARAASAALTSLGVEPGDRVATLAWNTHRHLELYFAVPAMGCVLHTVNLRLSSVQIAEVVRHGGARVLLADPETALAVDRDELGRAGIRHFVSLSGPEAAPPGWSAYETLLGPAPRSSWVAIDEEAPAALCYTSGTTGEPKGVAYTHRALALHTLGICLPDGFGLSEADVILPAVPMFHANAWGLPYAAAMTGAGLVLPGVHPDAARYADLLASERVTFAAGVPTVWMEVLKELRARPRDLAPGLRIHAGGAPSPPSMIEAYREELGIEIVTGWGMTELTPVGMATHPRAEMRGWSHERLLPVRTSQGTPLPFVEARIVREDGTPVPSDGETPGELEVRGPWVTAGYYRRDAPESFRDGWLRTGDVATRDAYGYFRLVDRTKDLIRSGGEWISSVRLEHALMGRPGVAEAAVVAVPDVKWQERPWAFVVLAEDGVEDVPGLLGPLEEEFPRWWLPERVLFVEAIPRTSTGKFDKKVLRARAREIAAAEG
jgi:fatty-acyl-CoA synthase